MYEVYINDRPLNLCSPEKALTWAALEGAGVLTGRYTGKPRQLFQYIDYLEKNPTAPRVALYAEDPDVLWRDFAGLYEPVEAAGGVVSDPEGRLLVMYRRGFWDLPKGKIDPGETPEEAAIREVREETGLQNLVLGEALTPTWHTYTQKNKRFLKKTHWFRMQSADRELIPQTEEDIEEICWVDRITWLAGNPSLYLSLRRLLEQL